jgi:Flp pilus assembly pilin Flp
MTQRLAAFLADESGATDRIRAYRGRHLGCDYFHRERLGGKLSKTFSNVTNQMK